SKPTGLPPASRPPSAPAGPKSPPDPTAALTRPTLVRAAVTAPTEVPVGVAIATQPGEAGTVTARQAGGLRDMSMQVDPRRGGIKAALQHLAKAVNIAFQTDFGENYLESVYQAAIVRRGEVHIIHKEYFGFGD